MFFFFFSGQNLASNASDEGKTAGFALSPGFITGVTVYAVIIFIVAVIGNSLVIYIVSAREYMRNSTNILGGSGYFNGLYFSLHAEMALCDESVVWNIYGNSYVQILSFRPSSLCRLFCDKSCLYKP